MTNISNPIYSCKLKISYGMLPGLMMVTHELQYC